MNRTISAIIATGFLCGCSMINPYQSEFSCPDTFKGKCASVREVYLEDGAGGQGSRELSTSATTSAKAGCTTAYSGTEGGGLVTTCSETAPETATTPAASSATTMPPGANPEVRNFNQYRSALFDRFAGLLKEPKTPIVAPPKVMRVLLMPYTGQENEFYMLRYVYFFVDKPRWILGDSVTADGEEE